MQIKDDALIWEDESGPRTAPLYSEEAFSVINHLWLKMGWQFHTHYQFSWMGRPVLQLPEDLVRMQELIVALTPDLIIETGVAMGGSLLFYASLVRGLNKGHVIGIDVDLRPHNRKAIEEHELASHITVIEGSSIAPQTLASVEESCKGAKTVLVILDSNHSKRHVLAELTAYAPLVTKGSYLIVADGFKKHLHDVPRGKERWQWDNPFDATEEFLQSHPEFVAEEPKAPYHRAKVSAKGSHFLSGFLRKI